MPSSGHKQDRNVHSSQCVVLLSQMGIKPFLMCVFMLKTGYDFSAETRALAKLAF